MLSNFTLVFTASKTVTHDVKEDYIKVQVKTKRKMDLKAIKAFSFQEGVYAKEEININHNKETFSSLLNCINTPGDNLSQKVNFYLKSLSSEEVAIIKHEYMKYVDSQEPHDLLHIFTAGLCSYLALIMLIHHPLFTNQLPFYFVFPCTIDSEHVCTINTFRYLSIPLTMMLKFCKGPLLEMVLFVQSFINLWEPLFIKGPEIGIANEARMYVDIISSLAQYVSASMIQANLLIQGYLNKIKDLESIIEKQVEKVVNKNYKTKINKITSNETKQADLEPL